MKLSMSRRPSRLGQFALLMVVFSLLSFLGACATAPGERVLQPVQSPNDDYSYRLLQLNNGMHVLLISDPDTPKAAASLDVLVGSGDNPKGRAGLAHFLEHMLFLGTDKYPNAAEYEEFITEHGGNRNAYTSLENTNYFFDINPPHLHAALDRFAQFFIAPRFDAQYVEREKNAVEAEYQMGLKSDPRRDLDVFQELMNPEHPFSQFTVGDLESLADRPGSSIRDELLNFYVQHYSANMMRLVVLGSESLDELQAIVEPLFSEVPNHNVQPSVIDAPLFAEQSLPLRVDVKPLATARELDVSFPIPEYRTDYRTKVVAYVGSLVGHEGEGSLLSQLKAEGLAEGLSAGTGLSWRGGEVFSVNIALTEKGVAQVQRVQQLLFAYLDMLRTAGPLRWYYEEQAMIADLGFRFREQSSPMGYVSALASGMHRYAMRDVLRGPYRMDKYDEARVQDIYSRLTPDNALVVLNDQSVTTDRVSKYYQVPYAVRPLATDALRIAAHDPALGALKLPAPNEFLAENTDLVALREPVPTVPELALSEDRQSIWFQQDDEFRVPKGSTYVNFRAPMVNATVREKVLGDLYAALVMDQVNEFAYPAHIAGLTFGFYQHARGITLNVNGYNDKQALLLQRLLQVVQKPELDPERFANIRKDMIRNLQNSVAKRPSSQLIDDLNEALLYGYWGEQARVEVLQSVDLAAVRDFAQRFLASAQIEALVYGNYEKKAVQALSDALASVLPAGSATAIAPLRVLRLRPGEEAQYRVNIPHDDAVLGWYLQARERDWKDKAAAALTGQIIKSGFFQQLRTEQQLGYVVSAFYWPKHDIPGLVLLIQSPVADANALAESMETFMRGVLSTLDAAQFERHREALLSDILRPDKNLSERAQYYWRAIARKQLDFSAREHLAEQVRALSMNDWRDYFEAVFRQQRHSLQVVSPGSRGKFPGGKHTVYRNATELKADHTVYQLP